MYKALVIGKHDYHETSLQVDILTGEGRVQSLLARGVRTEKHRCRGYFEVFSELELETEAGYKHHFLKEAVFLRNMAPHTLTSQRAAWAGMELLQQCTPLSEPLLYQLTVEYLLYLDQSSGHPALFWRYAARLCTVLGLHLPLDYCTVCGKEKEPAAYVPVNHGVICAECLRRSPHRELPELTPLAGFILPRLYHLQDVLAGPMPDRATVESINRMFTDHLHEHLHRRFTINSYKDYTP